MILFKIRRDNKYKPGLAWFCIFALFWITLLLYAGGFTTSIEAGMAFLDWPLSNGSINPAGWMEDREMRAEHSHRLLGMKIGILSIILVIWTQIREDRRWVRRVALILLLMVILQGCLGGARVVFDRFNIHSESNFIAQSFAIIHACGAQIILSLLVTLSLVCSRHWIERNGGLKEPAPNSVGWAGLIACITLFIAITFGAIMRHADVGLAISTFPYSTWEGNWLPINWNWAVSINFAHRVSALLASIAILFFIGNIWKFARISPTLGWLSILPLLLLFLQIFLGATVTWSRIHEHAATAHMLNGAFLLASCWMLTFLSMRLSPPFFIPHKGSKLAT